MTSADEHELHRLTKILESLDHKLVGDPAAHEALQKAALSLSLTFIRGLRPEMEDQFQKLGTPLTAAERAHLRSLDIQPK